MAVVQAQKESLISLSTMYMIQFKHTLYHAVVIRGQDEGQNHDHFLQGVCIIFADEIKKILHQ